MRSYKISLIYLNNVTNILKEETPIKFIGVSLLYQYVILIV
jgi:hypothetical protein